MIDEITTIINSSIEQSFLDGLVEIGILNELQLTILETGPRYELIKKIRQIKEEWDIEIYQRQDPVNMYNYYYIHCHRLGKAIPIGKIETFL